MVNPVFVSAIIATASAVNADNACRGSNSGTAEGNFLLINPATNADAVCAGTTTGFIVVGPDGHATTGAPNTPS